MPDPTWTREYNTGQAPDAQGFTLQSTDTPSINPVTAGAPASRRLEIDSTNGDAVYIQDSEPTTFDPTIGLTGEIDIQVNGGNFGIEFTFLDMAILLEIQSDNVNLYSPTQGEHGFAVDMTTRRMIRITTDASQQARVYIDEVLRIGPQPMLTLSTRAAKRFLFWHERWPTPPTVTGGLSTFWAMRYYDGGPVLPG